MDCSKAKDVDKVKVALLIVSILFSINICAQKKAFYVSDEHNYSVLIDQNAQISKRSDEDAFTDYFVVNDSDSIFKYYYSVTKLNLPKKELFDLYDESYITSFKKECGCLIESKKKVLYNNIDGVEFEISAIKGDHKLSGFSVSTLTGGNALYSVTFLTLDEKVHQYLSEYKNFINSFVINQK